MKLTRSRDGGMPAFRARDHVRGGCGTFLYHLLDSLGRADGVTPGPQFVDRRDQHGPIRGAFLENQLCFELRRRYSRVEKSAHPAARLEFRDASTNDKFVWIAQRFAPAHLLEERTEI